MKKLDVQEAVTNHFEMMGIPLASLFKELVVEFVHPKTIKTFILYILTLQLHLFPLIMSNY